MKTGCAEACETRRAARVRANERRILLILRPGWGLPLRRRAERERRQEFTVFGPALAMLFFFEELKRMELENDAGRDEKKCPAADFSRRRPVTVIIKRRDKSGLAVG